MPTRVPWDSPKRNHGQLHADFAAIARAVQSRGHPKPGSSGDGEITVCSSVARTHTVYVGKFKRTGEWYVALWQGSKAATKKRRLSNSRANVDQWLRNNGF